MNFGRNLFDRLIGMINGNSILSKRGYQAIGLNSAISIYDRIMYLVTLFILSRLLTPSDFGNFALATLISTVCLQLFEFGFGWTFIHRQDSGKDILTTHTALQIFSTGIGLVPSIFIVPVISRFYGYEVAH
jgi:O-antigen/teichoic acid export membrane protein